jgi:hypothetical protein
MHVRKISWQANYLRSARAERKKCGRMLTFTLATLQHAESLALTVENAPSSAGTPEALGTLHTIPEQWMPCSGAIRIK